MANYIISAEDIKNLINELIKQNWNVVSNSPDGINYVYINDGNNLFLDSTTKPSNVSFKEFFFPRTEPLFFFKKQHNEIELIDPKANSNPTIIFGAKPCDAAGLPIMSKVMNWDYKDEFFNNKVENTLVVGLACNYEDEYCFCESIGIGPDAEKGSDIFLKNAENNRFIAKAVSDRGEKFINNFKKYFIEANENDIKIIEHIRKNKQKKFDKAVVKKWLDENFNNPFWNKLGDICLGCAQCAFVCPVCHCFDIVDEDCRLNCGRRVKNWDACQFPIFTKHASGHNPRENQSERYRQRINHKFKYYVDKFDEILCTGCGRCSRGCSVGIDIGEILVEINEMNKA